MITRQNALQYKRNGARRASDNVAVLVLKHRLNKQALAAASASDLSFMATRVLGCNRD